MSGRNIRACDLVQLWARSAGMCSHPQCKQRLVLDASGNDEASSIGQAAHIVARKAKGPRGAAPLDGDRVDGYENLILLCANHHAMVDRQPWTNKVEDLRAWKAEHEAWVETATALRPEPLPWTAIVQEERRRMDLAEAVEALGAGNRVAETLELRSDIAAEGWDAAATHEWRQVGALLATTPAERRRFAVFPLGRIPLAVQLGYVLGDRARAEVYHYDRDRASWQWERGATGAGAVTWTVEERAEGPRDEAVVRVSLSAGVRPECTLRSGVELDVRVPEPSVRWLRAPSQVAELSRVFGEVLGAARDRACRRVHLYYAGPAAGAVTFGRAYNPRMNPELVVYEYARPGYERALALNR